MTAQPKISEFLPNGEIRTADLIKTIASQIDDMARPRHGHGQIQQYAACQTELHAFARRLRRLAETIERGK